MTLRILKAQNVLSDNEIFFPEKFRALDITGRAALPAVSFVGQRDCLERGFTEVIASILPTLIATVPGATELKLFCAQWQFFEDTAMVRRKGLWRSSNLLQEVIASASLQGPECICEHKKFIRFYRICSTEMKKATLAIEAIRSMSTCFGFIANNCDVSSREVAESLYKLAFSDPPKVGLDWPSLILQLARDGRILVRATGGFDDRELAIDFFNYSFKGFLNSTRQP